jgi:hypothetical protein
MRQNGRDLKALNEDIYIDEKEQMIISPAIFFLSTSQALRGWPDKAQCPAKVSLRCAHIRQDFRGSTVAFPSVSRQVRKKRRRVGSGKIPK